MQDSGEDAATTSLKVPVRQFMQEGAPGRLEKVPGAHAAQSVGKAEPAGLNRPAAQAVHAADEDWPEAVLKVPAAQGLQPSAPADAAKRPGAQAVQAAGEAAADRLP